MASNRDHDYEPGCEPRLVKTIVDPNLLVETESSRKSKLDKDLDVRRIKSYSLETSLIEYLPRLLVVPSREYSTLQCAIDAIKPRRGGYVIKLTDPSMEYTITKPLSDDQIDYLTILGSPEGLPYNPFNGRSYTQRVREEVDMDDGGSRVRTTLPKQPLHRFIPSAGCSESVPVDCLPDFGPETFGVGPFDVSLHGNTFTVKSYSGIHPCFDDVPIGSRILIISEDGGIGGQRIGVVQRTRGNSLSFSSIGSGGPISRSSNILDGDGTAHGTGFAFIPDIRVEVVNEGTSLEVMDYLLFENIELYAPPMFYVHATRGTVTLRNCWVSGTIVFRGRYYLKVPNIFTGLVLLWPASDGEAYCQTLYSLSSRMQGITTTGLWSYCHFLNMPHGAEMMHGSNMNFSGTEFVRCCLGISAQARSHVTLTNVVLAHCRCALMLVYNSMASSVNTAIPGAPTSELLLGPWFISNVFMIVVFRNSEVVCPMTSGVHNLIPFIIDGKVYTTVESNPLMNIGSFNSMALILANPFVPEPKRFGCTTLDELIEFDLLDAWGVASPSFVADMSRRDNDFNVLAQETIDVVSKYDGRDHNRNIVQI